MNRDDTMRTEWALLQLNNAFVYFMDNAQFESMIELFTEDALFDRAGTVHRGHQELRQGVRERPKATTRHLLNNFYFTDVEEDSAAGIVCAMVYHGPPSENGEPVVYATTNGRVIEYHDSYVKTAAGWRFSSRVARAIFRPEVWP